MSAFTKGTRTWCAEHCNQHCSGACQSKMHEANHKIPHNGHAIQEVNCKVRRTWLGGPK